MPYRPPSLIDGKIFARYSKHEPFFPQMKCDDKIEVLTKTTTVLFPTCWHVKDNTKVLVHCIPVQSLATRLAEPIPLCHIPYIKTFVFAHFKVYLSCCNEAKHKNMVWMFRTRISLFSFDVQCSDAMYLFKTSIVSSRFILGPPWGKCFGSCFSDK